MVLKDFPDQIKIKIGPGWKNPFPNLNPAPFVENEEITLVRCITDDYTLSGSGDFNWWEEQIAYSEDGTQTPSATNRLYLEIIGYLEIGSDYSYYYKTEAVSCYDNLSQYSAPIFASCFNFDIENEFPTASVPDECYFYFKDIFDMETKFSRTEFDYLSVNPDYLDLDAYAVKNYYNPNTFLSMVDAEALAYITGIQRLLNALFPEQGRQLLMPNMGIENLLKLKNSLGIEGFNSIINSLGEQSIQRILIDLQIDYIQNVLKILNSFGEQGKLIHSSGIGVNELQKLLFNLGTSSQSIQRNLNSITAASITQINRILTTIEEQNIVQSIHKIIGAMDDLQTTALFLSTAYEIYIDGLPCKSRINSLQISMSESEVHDSFSFNSSDPRLYSQCNPATTKGEMRIEIHVGTRIFYFLLEERSGNHIGFQVWGRSLTAKIDSPHEVETDYSIVSPDSAKDIAETIADTVSLTWQIDDWILPDNFSYRGYPIEGIISIAESVGAICRNDDSGNLIVRYKYPVRPVDIENATPVIEYEPESSLIQLDVKETIGTKENTIEVQGRTEDVELPMLELEEAPSGNYLIGTDIIVRAYWGTENPPEITEYYSTDGRVRLLSNYKSQTKTETVTFKDGQAISQYPIVRIKKTSWIGRSGGSVSWKKFSNELYITETKARVAEITYETVYQTYKLYNHNVSTLIFVMVINSKYDVSVRVKMGSADNEASALSKPWLTNSSVAAKAGIAYLDDKKYDTTEINFIAPYNDLAKDGIIVSITDPNVGLSGKCHVRECTIEFNGPKVTNQITAVQFKVSA